MSYIATENRKKLREVSNELGSLDRAILAKCKFRMNITRVIKAGKPFFNSSGDRMFATTDEVLASVEKLIKLGLLERR